MKKIILFAVSIMLLINMALAGVQFFQEKRDLGNKTFSNRLLFCYDKNMVAVLGDIKDYISGNNLFQAYILYSIYPKKWNSDNPNYAIDYCNFILKQSSRQTNYTAIFNQTIRAIDSDITNAQYFFNLNDGDCVIAEQKCVYDFYANTSNLDIPTNLQLVTPSWECKACQYYSWSLTEQMIEKTNLINSNVVTTSGFIKKFISLNFEILLMVFWTFLILMGSVALGFIFLIAFWFLIYLRRIIK
jgi:hypothetical protein